jgi:hypothetical protein
MQQQRQQQQRRRQCQSQCKLNFFQLHTQLQRLQQTSQHMTLPVHPAAGAPAAAAAAAVPPSPAAAAASQLAADTKSRSIWSQGT